MKILSKIILPIISIFNAILIGSIVILKLPAGGPCVCPDTAFQYNWDSVIYVLFIRNQLNSFANYQCSIYGCAIDHYIFPIDLIIIEILLVGLLIFWNLRKKKV